VVLHALWPGSKSDGVFFRRWGTIFCGVGFSRHPARPKLLALDVILALPGFPVVNLSANRDAFVISC
jgi:hypothetical protein